MGLFDRIAQAVGYTPSRTVAPAIREAVDQTMRDYALSFPTPLLSGAFGGGGSSTGIPITPLSALQSAAVYACVKRKAEDLAKLPVIVEHDVSGAGDWQQDVLHPLSNVLRKPNRWMTPFAFWRYMAMSVDLRGNAIAVIRRGWNGSPEALIPLNWDRVSVLLSPTGELFYNVSHPQIGFGVTFHQDDILHIRGLTVDGGYLGMTPIGVAQDVVGLAIATQQHGAILFRQGAQISKVLRHPGKLSTEAAQRIAQSAQNVFGGVQNAHKTMVLEEGMDITSLSMTNEDAQFLQTRAFQVLEICRMFGVPPHKVYDLSKSNFSTLEQQEQAYVNDTLDPLAINVQQESGSKLFFEDEQVTWRIRFDFSSLLRGDQKAQSEYYSSMLNNGIMSVNEVRREKGLAPVPGGDAYRVPLNTAPLGSAAAAGKKDEPTEKPPGVGDQIGTDNDGSGAAPIESETGDTVF